MGRQASSKNLFDRSRNFDRDGILIRFSDDKFGKIAQGCSVNGLA
jgi:hypothetical protein